MNRAVPNRAYDPAMVRAPDASLPFILGTLAVMISLLFGVYWLSALGMGAFTYYFVRLLLEAGVDLPIESFILVTASLQWIVGPMLAYAGFSHHYKFYMYVPEDEYMALAVPGVILLSLGLYAFRSVNRIHLVHHYAGITRLVVRSARHLPYYLIGVGFVFSFLVDRFPASLAFPAYLLSNVKYIGLIYLIFSERQQHKAAILILAFLLTFLSSLKAAMFHDMLLWTAFIGMYAAYVLRPTTAKKIVAVMAALVFVFVLQAAKDEYRGRLMKEGRTEYVEKFIETVDQRFEDNERSRGNNVENVVNRINQGWIISRIMTVVPDHRSFAGGSTVVTALKASVLPRFLYPDKPVAGGKANYEKYTGFILQSSTSMGISLLGEAYINFGLQGAWLFMFVFGLVSSFIIKRFFLLALKYPTIWLWFPLVLLHFVKAETELLVQLNFLVKSIILVYVFVWANKHFLNLKL